MSLSSFFKNFLTPSTIFTKITTEVSAEWAAVETKVTGHVNVVEILIAVALLAAVLTAFLHPTLIIGAVIFALLIVFGVSKYMTKTTTTVATVATAPITIAPTPAVAAPVTVITQTAV